MGCVKSHGGKVYIETMETLKGFYRKHKQYVLLGWLVTAIFAAAAATGDKGTHFVVCHHIGSMTVCPK